MITPSREEIKETQPNWSASEARNEPSPRASRTRTKCTTFFFEIVALSSSSKRRREQAEGQHTHNAVSRTKVVGRKLNLAESHRRRPLSFPRSRQQCPSFFPCLVNSCEGKGNGTEHPDLFYECIHQITLLRWVNSSGLTLKSRICHCPLCRISEICISTDPASKSALAV